MILESLDGLGQSLVINITVQRSGEMIHMTIEEVLVLPSKSLWNSTVLPYGCEADTVVDGMELSKSQRLSVMMEDQAYLYLPEFVIPFNHRHP